MLTGLTANAQLFDNGNNSTLPGLMIIGSSPQTINSPQTSRELVALLPSLVNTNGIVPKSFGIEFTPFWIFDTIRETYTFSEFHNASGFTQKLKKIRSQTSISVGINSGIADTNSRNIGIGIRSKLLNGKPDPVSKLLFEKIEDVNILQIFIESHFNKMPDTFFCSCSQKDSLLNALNKYMDRDTSISAEKRRHLINVLQTAIDSNQCPKNIESSFKNILNDFFCSFILKDSLTISFNKYMDQDTSISVEKRRRLINILQNAMDSVKCATTKQEYKKMLLLEITKSQIDFKVENIKYHPIGHLLEFNAAYGMQFPSARWEYSRSRRAAAWLNYTYRCKSQKFEATAMIRGLADSLDFRTRWAFDAGGLAKWTPAKSFTASVEAAVRYRPYLTVQPFTWQVMVNFEYEIDKNFALTANFGRSFEGQYTSGGNMLTLFGVNYNLLSHKN